MLDVKQLKLVRYVALEGSLTRAAERLFLTQSALSHQLKTLEDRLQMRLFGRAGRRMLLTQAGHRLLRAAEETLAILDRAEADLALLASGKAGRIRISTECYTCYHWLPALVRSYRAGNGSIEIDLVPEATSRSIDALLSGEIDIAIVSHDPRDERIDSVGLFEDEKVAVVHPGHRLAGRSFVEPQDFADEHLLLHNRDSSGVLRDFLHSAGVYPRRVSEIMVTEGIRELVKAGAGLAVVARWAAAPDIASGELVPLRLTEGGQWRVWRAAYLGDWVRPSYFGEFIACIKNTLPGDVCDSSMQMAAAE